MDVDFPTRFNQLWEILVFLYFLDPRTYITPASRLYPYGLAVAYCQNVDTIPKVNPLTGIGTPPLYDPAPVAKIAQVLQGSLGWTHVVTLQHYCIKNH